jgi:hypothetical protein
MYKLSHATHTTMEDLTSYLLVLLSHPHQQEAAKSRELVEIARSHIYLDDPRRLIEDRLLRARGQARRKVPSPDLGQLLPKHHHHHHHHHPESDRSY